MTLNSNLNLHQTSTLTAMNRHYPTSDILDLVADAQKIHVFTGAGMSAESGLETYRNNATGLWEMLIPKPWQVSLLGLKTQNPCGRGPVACPHGFPNAT